MFETIVVATDGSGGVDRAVAVALDLARRFDAEVHALSVVNERELDSAPDSVREEMQEALRDRAEEAVAEVSGLAGSSGVDVRTAVREGAPPREITAYARSIDADCVALGASGRHGENRFLVGTVAERVVERCPVPVLTVRRETEADTAGESDATAD